MSKYIIDSDTLQDIADSIRLKTGKSATMTPLEMPDEIASISAGVTVEPLSVTANGTYTAPTGKAYSPVTVNVSGGGGSTDYFYIEGVEAGTIGFTATGTVDVALQYSTDKTNWTDYTLGTDVNITVGQKIYWKNNKYYLSTATDKYVVISSSNAFNVGGRINSLINDIDGIRCPQYAFLNLFEGSNIVDASNLILNISVDKQCYYGMFQNCQSLTTAPELPATTLAQACYQNMFYGCTSLTTSPSLSATTLAEMCYGAMFRDCTSLTTVPKLLATTLQSSCYTYMFAGCTSLKVYSESGEGHDKAWSIPTEGVISGTTRTQNNMFNGVETDSVPINFPGTTGQQYTYYTQNEPV